MCRPIRPTSSTPTSLSTATQSIRMCRCLRQHQRHKQAMAWIFGDGFDVYATTADPIAGYWDSGVTNSWTLTPGRFAGSQAIRSVANSGIFLTKSSGVNDAVHHIICAFLQTAAISGSTLSWYLQLLDGVTNQCCIVFR